MSNDVILICVHTQKYAWRDISGEVGRLRSQLSQLTGQKMDEHSDSFDTEVEGSREGEGGGGAGGASWCSPDKHLNRGETGRTRVGKTYSNLNPNGNGGVWCSANREFHRGETTSETRAGSQDPLEIFSNFSFPWAGGGAGGK